jgi:hypothetical protein
MMAMLLLPPLLLVLVGCLDATDLWEILTCLGLLLLLGILAVGAWDGSRVTAILGTVVFAVWFVVAVVGVAASWLDDYVYVPKDVVGGLGGVAYMGVLLAYFVWRAVGRRP